MGRELRFEFNGDSETGLDYAFARYYSSRLARFMPAGPLGAHRAIRNL